MLISFPENLYSRALKATKNEMSAKEILQGRKKGQRNGPDIHSLNFHVYKVNAPGVTDGSLNTPRDQVVDGRFPFLGQFVLDVTRLGRFLPVTGRLSEDRFDGRIKAVAVKVESQIRIRAFSNDGFRIKILELELLGYVTEYGIATKDFDRVKLLFSADRIDESVYQGWGRIFRVARKVFFLFGGLVFDTVLEP